MVRSGRNPNSSKTLCMSSLPASIKRIWSKTTEKRWWYHFPHYKSMGAFCCHGNQSFDPICPKTLCSLFPTPVMLHTKFYQDWPTGFRDIPVWKCGQWMTTDGPLVYYKLTLWPIWLRWANDYLVSRLDMGITVNLKTIKPISAHRTMHKCCTFLSEQHY